MSGEASSADIERDAESERAGLIDTLDQLRENLKPANVLDEVLAGAKISMSDVSDRVWHTAKNNPIPSVLIGLGAAMLLGVGQKLKSHEARKSDDWSASKRFPESRPSFGAPAQSQRSPLIKTASSSAKPHIAAQLDAVSVRASLAASKIADSASDLRQHASRKVNQYTSSARQGLSSISGDTAMTQYARSRDQVTHSISKLLDEQPLVLAALGIAVGAAIGAAIPASETEGQWMGEASGSVKQAARDLARDQFQHIKETAGQTLDDVKRAAAEHGLSTENLSDLVHDVGSKVQTGAYQVAGQVSDATQNRS